MDVCIILTWHIPHSSAKAIPPSIQPLSVIIVKYQKGDINSSFFESLLSWFSLSANKVTFNCYCNVSR